MAEETQTRRETVQRDVEPKHPWAVLTVIGIVGAALGIGLALLIDWFPAAASTQADPIDTLWDVLLIVSVPIFVLVQGVVLYCVWRFRMRPGQENMDGPPIHGNTRLEVIWTLLPALLIFGLCTYAYIVLTDIEDARAGEMRINVVGQQFTWTFEYPQPDGRPVRSGQLYVPAGQPVHFYVKTIDVIHDFWVPAWRMKIDAVPGVTTDLRVTPTRKGRFEVVCAELCGLGHAYMRQAANVVDRQAFDTWLADKKRGAGGPPSGTPGDEGADPDGQTLFVEGNGEAAPCGACHKLEEAGTAGGTGPDLDKVLAGKDAEYIRREIVSPNDRLTRGFSGGIMPPNYGQVLSDAELEALVTYLEEATP